MCWPRPDGPASRGADFFLTGWGRDACVYVSGISDIAKGNQIAIPAGQQVTALPGFRIPQASAAIVTNRARTTPAANHSRAPIDMSTPAVMLIVS
jgi:hypothetical protein